MKKGLRILLFAAALLLAFGLASCGEEARVPEDMQLARGGEEWGYDFFVPEGWVVANYGEFASAYVSAINPTTVTFGEAEMPEYGKDADGFTEAEIKKYFKERMANLAYTSTVVPITEGVRAPFGNEPNAYKFDFTYDYPRQDGTVIKYRSLQYLIVRGERFYIFQYNSQNTPPNYSADGRTYFDIYLEDSANTVTAADVIAQFRFYDIPGTRPTPVAGSSGELVLVSDKSISGFEFYAPSDSVAVASTALVHRDLGEGGSVSVSEFVSNTQTAHPDDYWVGIMANLEKAYGKITHLNPVTEETKNTNRRDIKGANWGFFYEYTYTYAGVDYRGYTMLIRADSTFSKDAYVLNYTAREDAYNQELLDRMLDRLEF